MIRRYARRQRRIKLWLAAGATATLFSGNCLSSDIAKRFRDAYVPSLATGLSLAVSSLDPEEREAGLRQAWGAFNEGLAAIIKTRPDEDD